MENNDIRTGTGTKEETRSRLENVQKENLEQETGDAESRPKTRKARIAEDKAIENSRRAKDQFRVVIDHDPNMYLERVLDKLNEGFEGGVITKSDLAIYVFRNLERYISDSDMKEMRSLHFDDRRMLASLLKNADDPTELPDEIRKVLREFYGISEKDKKRGQKAA